MNGKVALPARLSLFPGKLIFIIFDEIFKTLSVHQIETINLKFYEPSRYF